MPVVTEPSGNTVPSSAVLDAFGAKGAPVPLIGGQGRSVLVGGFVFKPAEGAEDEIEWAARAFHAALRKLPRPDLLDRRTHPWS